MYIFYYAGGEFGEVMGVFFSLKSTHRTLGVPASDAGPAFDV